MLSSSLKITRANIMTNSPANQTRLKILSSILELERFTVAELCRNAGLSRSQVYRELSILDKSRALTSKPIRPEGKGPAFRPTKLYELSSDPAVRQDFVREIGSFLPTFEDPSSNHHLRLAKKVRDELDLSLNSEAISQMSNAAFGVWEKQCKEAIAQAEKSIQRANWESETDFSVGDHSKHPVIATTRSIELLRSKFQQIYANERSRRDKDAARPQWFKILIPVVQAMLPEMAALGLRANQMLVIAGISELSKVLSLSVVKHYSKGPKNDALVQYLDALQLDLRTAQSKSDLLAVFAKHFISYGSHVNETLEFAQRLAKESKNYRFVFNEANLAHLACKQEEAYSSWSDYASARKSGHVLGERSLIARISAKNWSLTAYEAAINEITKDHVASVCTFAEVSFDSVHQHVMKPKLYNPVSTESERESTWIQMAEPLAPDTKLYALSTETACPVIGGLPKIARANCFLQVLPEKDAWDLASEEDSEERVVKVDFFRAATPESRRSAAAVLTSNLSAILVG